MAADFLKTRAQKRAYINSLAAEYGVSFHIAQKAVDSDKLFRIIALASGDANPSKAFMAAVNVLTK